MSLLPVSYTHLMFVFATCSSVATIPVNLKCVKKLGVSDEIANFVIPFGAVMNMNGTAIYEAVAVIFTAQVYGIEPVSYTHLDRNSGLFGTGNRISAAV